MDVKIKNQHLLEGNLDIPGLFPQLEQLKTHTVQFDADFGLKSVPTKPGVVLIRGARQLGKSTWLEQQILKQIKQYGPGSAIYLNGDELLNSQEIVNEVKTYLSLIPKSVQLPTFFIDEITSVPKWEFALKRLYDSGDTRHALIVTTGSKAVDLRRGTERLPGRKGRLERTNYLFTPISFAQFKEKCSKFFGDQLLTAYILTGGSPLATNELIRTGKIPEYIAELTRDWVYGECALQGRSRNLLTWIIHALMDRGGTPVSLDKLAKESGAANNTVIQGYIELLQDLLCLSSSLLIDASHRRPIPRKAHKYHFTHLLAAVSFHPAKPRSIQEFLDFSPEEQGRWLEWLVAQELWRKAAIQGVETPEIQYFWQSHDHELDFLIEDRLWLEVKRGQSHSIEFSWFPKVFPKDRLKVICSNTFSNSFSESISIEDFLTH